MSAANQYTEHSAPLNEKNNAITLKKISKTVKDEPQ